MQPQIYKRAQRNANNQRRNVSTMKGSVLRQPANWRKPNHKRPRRVVSFDALSRDQAAFSLLAISVVHIPA
jgi:hypothetical protein